ncbi:hypothetical protein KY285_025943 [Solanum tuberosum]|nr:hypothetical protein KY285_025943 [Solanum tuberosum]
MHHLKPRMQKLQRKGVERLPLLYLDPHYQRDYLRTRYAALLWKYGTDKAKAGYVSENDDRTRPKSDFLPSADDEIINVD